MPEQKNRYNMLDTSDREEAIRIKKMKQGLIPDTENEEYLKKKKEESEKPVTPKEKWDNFWYHYRWTVLAVGFFVVAVSFLTIQALTREKYDTTLMLGNYTYFSQEQLDSITDSFSKYIKDVDGDGKKSVSIFQAKYIAEGSDEEATGVESSMHARIITEIASGQNNIFIMEKELLEPLIQKGAFADLKSLNITKESGFSFCVKDSKLFKNKLFSNEDDNLYMAVRVYKKGTDKEKYDCQVEAVKKLYNEMNK